jgi:plasmid stabilization system protein ParE
MPYTVSILRRAEADVTRIYRWLGKRSPTGANRWYEALESAIDQLASDAHRNPLAAESARLGTDVRECFFKTRRGSRYRILYVIALSQVRILRIRGPGQRPLRRPDLGG